MEKPSPRRRLPSHSPPPSCRPPLSLANPSLSPSPLPTPAGSGKLRPPRPELPKIHGRILEPHALFFSSAPSCLPSRAAAASPHASSSTTLLAAWHVLLGLFPVLEVQQRRRAPPHGHRQEHGLNLEKERPGVWPRSGEGEQLPADSAADWIKCATPPGFASRCLESRWPLSRVTSIARKPSPARPPGSESIDIRTQKIIQERGSKQQTKAKEDQSE